MNSRQRFLTILQGGQPDRPPLFPEGIRAEVRLAWQEQGLDALTPLEQRFTYDPFEELLPEIYPLPAIEDWSDTRRVLRLLEKRLDPDDPRRLPEGWPERLADWQGRAYPLFVRAHQGLFLSLGIEAWRSFAPALLRLVDQPAFVKDVLAIQSRFAARLLENLLRQVSVDGVIFSEPIAGNHGALISPAMYRDLVLPGYAPLFEVIRRHAIPACIWRSYANPGALIPTVVAGGFNVLWLCETPPAALGPAQARRLAGEQVTLIGGIDTDVLRQGKAAIDAAIQAAWPFVAQGRFIPLADGRVREDVPFENYAYYRRRLGGKADSRC